jgi:hypothetical protein
MESTTKPSVKRGRAKRRPEPLTVAATQRKREVEMATAPAAFEPGSESEGPSALDEFGVRLSGLLYPGRARRVTTSRRR